jgi:AcrR family transcriptional regulator
MNGFTAKVDFDILICSSSYYYNLPRLDIQMPRRILDEEREQQREQVFGVAIPLFIEKGFRDTTLAEIAKGVGCSDAHILRLFGGKKDGLLKAFFERAADQINTFIRQVASIPSGDAKQRLLQIYRQFLEWLREDEYRTTVFLMDVRPYGQLADALIQANSAVAWFVDNMIQEGKQRGVFQPEVHTQAFRQQIMGSIAHIQLGLICKDCTSYPAEYTIEDACRTFESLLNGITIKESPGEVRTEIEH